MNSKKTGRILTEKNECYNYAYSRRLKSKQDKMATSTSRLLSSESDSDGAEEQENPSLKINEHDESMQNNCPEPPSATECTVMIIFGLALCIVVFWFVFSNIIRNSEKEKQSNFNRMVDEIDTHINCSFDNLRRKYPSQEKVLWRSLRTGIERILNTEKPYPSLLVYLLLHGNENNKFKELVENIAQITSKCFDPHSKPIELSVDDFNSEDALKDYGVIIDSYKSKLKKSSVTLVANLNEIPSEAAQALHSICDTYSPMVHKSVVFLTLVPSINEGKIIEKAEQTLIKLWHSLPQNILVPLIARVTDQVFQLNSFQ